MIERYMTDPHLRKLRSNMIMRENRHTIARSEYDEIIEMRRQHDKFFKTKYSKTNTHSIL